MADAVAVKILHDGPRNVIVKLTSLSDGTGEVAVTKVNVADLVPTCARLRVDKIEYDLSAMQCTLLWEGTPNVTIATLSTGQGCLDFSQSGGVNMSGPGPTGNILLTTISAGNNDSYAIVLHLVKKF